MKHDRATALTTGLGALGAVVTMVLHPTHGIHGLEGEAMLRAARIAAAVHGLALASHAPPRSSFDRSSPRSPTC